MGYDYDSLGVSETIFTAAHCHLLEIKCGLNYISNTEPSYETYSHSRRCFCSSL